MQNQTPNPIDGQGNSESKRLPRRYRAVRRTSRLLETVANITAKGVRKVWRTSEVLDAWSVRAGQAALQKAERKREDRARQMKHAWEGAPDFVHKLAARIKRRKDEVLEKSRNESLPPAQEALSVSIQKLLTGASFIRSVSVGRQGEVLHVRVRLYTHLEPSPLLNDASLKSAYESAAGKFPNTVLEKVGIEENKWPPVGNAKRNIGVFVFNSPMPTPKKVLEGLLNQSPHVPLSSVGMSQRSASLLDLEGVFHEINEAHTMLNRLMAEQELWNGFQRISAKDWDNFKNGYDHLPSFHRKVYDDSYAVASSFPPQLREEIARSLFAQYAKLFQLHYYKNWSSAFEKTREATLNNYEKVLGVLELKFGEAPDGNVGDLKKSIKTNAERVYAVLGKGKVDLRPRLDTLLSNE